MIEFRLSRHHPAGKRAVLEDKPAKLIFLLTRCGDLL